MHVTFSHFCAYVSKNYILMYAILYYDYALGFEDIPCVLWAYYLPLSCITHSPLFLLLSDTGVDASPTPLVS